MVKNRIKKLIEDSGLKKKIIAERLGISRQTLNAWEKSDDPEAYKKVKSVVREARITYGDSNEISKERFEELEEKVKELTELVLTLTKENADLRKENIKLRVEIANLGELRGGKSKLNV